MNTVLVANRGEIAVRIIRAVHAAGGRAVAIYPADDADALHVRLADEALMIPGAGPAAYLDVEAIVTAALSARCPAIHPGASRSSTQSPRRSPAPTWWPPSSQ
jgi:acetyl/propionyl-CoA carboxylase alpha subunit